MCDILSFQRGAGMAAVNLFASKVTLPAPWEPASVLEAASWLPKEPPNCFHGCFLVPHPFAERSCFKVDLSASQG